MNFLRKKNIVISILILLVFLFSIYMMTRRFRTMPCVQSRILYGTFACIDRDWRKKGCPEIFVPSDYSCSISGTNQFYISTNQINFRGTNYHCGITLEMDRWFVKP